jgi:Ni/Co efflux regulator RcnB
MKKLLTLVFACVVALALSMPVFAQDAPAQEQTQEAPATTGKKKTHKMHKKAHKATKKVKKEKKQKEEKAPPSSENPE